MTLAFVMASPVAASSGLWLAVTVMLGAFALSSLLSAVGAKRTTPLIVALLLIGLLLSAAQVQAVIYAKYGCKQCIADGNAWYWCWLINPSGC